MCKYMKVNDHMFRVAGLKGCLMVIYVGSNLHLDQKHNFNGLTDHTCQIDKLCYHCKVLKARHTFLPTCLK